MKNVMYCLGALEAVLKEMNAPIETGAITAAQQAGLKQFDGSPKN